MNMKKFRFFWLIVAVTMLFGNITITSACTPPAPGRQIFPENTVQNNFTSIALGSSNISPLATNREFNLDFNKSRIWTWDFVNRGIIFLYNDVEVEYVSNTPSNIAARATIAIHIDSDKDGVYEPCPGYEFTLNSGSTLRTNVPDTNDVNNYRLVFVNLTSGVQTGTFRIKLF